MVKKQSIAGVIAGAYLGSQATLHRQRLVGAVHHRPLQLRDLRLEPDQGGRARHLQAVSASSVRGCLWHPHVCHSQTSASYTDAVARTTHKYACGCTNAVFCWATVIGSCRAILGHAVCIGHAVQPEWWSGICLYKSEGLRTHRRDRRLLLRLVWQHVRRQHSTQHVSFPDGAGHHT